MVSFVVKSGLAAAMTLLFGGAALGVSFGTAQTHPISSCRDDEHTYAITHNNTLNGIAQRLNTRWWAASIHGQIAPTALNASQNCAQRNQAVAAGGIANAAVMQQEVLHSDGKEIKFRALLLRRVSKVIKRQTHVTTAITPATTTTTATTTTATSTTTSSVPTYHKSSTVQVVRLKKAAAASPAFGPGNTFPYGVCTWYADERYHQMHGIYVPWHANANAWQWTARAYEYGWHVSSYPSVGSIMVLQGGVQGASWLGHVGVVERVLGNGRVVASSMNWGGYPGAVTTWSFSNGPGVTFVNQ